MDYTGGMKFEWDEAKSDACFKTRGFDFEYAAFAFADPDRWITLDTRRSYGEERYQLTGRIAGRLFVLVYTQRHQALRIISARKANQREIKHYENRSHQD